VSCHSQALIPTTIITISHPILFLQSFVLPKCLLLGVYSALCQFSFSLARQWLVGVVLYQPLWALNSLGTPVDLDALDWVSVDYVLHTPSDVQASTRNAQAAIIHSAHQWSSRGTFSEVSFSVYFLSNIYPRRHGW
jgi:hypothetical protein